MNSFKFFAPPPPRTALLLAGVLLLTLNLIMSCERDMSEHRSDGAGPAIDLASERTDCTGYCECSVTTFSDAVLNLCGDIVYAVTSCNFGCDPGDKGESAEFLEFEPRVFCVDNPGNVCIYNTSTMDSVAVRVSFGGSTPQIYTIPPSDRMCFSTNGSCDVTNLDCY